MCIICQLSGDPIIRDKLFYAAYIDPGTGYVFQSLVPALFGFLAATFGSVLLILRNKIIPFIKNHKRFFFFFVLALIIGTMIVVAKKTTMRKNISQKVVILGFDGMDPKILEEGFSKNLLPNLKKLKDTGYYCKLQTTVPPQSPVAWASFTTGVDPAKHGIYDFIVRNPQDYSLELVWAQKLKKLLRATPFWEMAIKNQIPSTILFLPDTFPPSKLDGKMIAGMGVPDVLGTAGTFSTFTTRPVTYNPLYRGNEIAVEDRDTVETQITGPKYVVYKDQKTSKIPLTIQKNVKNKKVTLRVENQTISLKENEFSGWVKLEFKIDFFTRVSGIVRFYLKSVSPDLVLYLSPINFDPTHPVHPISYPGSYAHDLAREYGTFYTLGLPHDTWALEENVFDDATFLKNADEIEAQREKIHFGELAKFKGGIFFSYFGITDTIQHMYWRFLDDPQSKYYDTILKYYQKIDAVVGKTIQQLGPKDTLIILSDHGFDRFDYEININSWLRDNGYLTLQTGKTTGGELLDSIDWGNTEAYAIGYNSLYFNRMGREKSGIVTKSDAEKLQKELTEKLLSITNPATGEKVIKKIYTREDLGIKDDDAAAPDLFIGYFAGIRSSWDTAVGATPKDVIVKRTSKWSGDHLFDPSEVPGILFSNKNLGFKNPKIIDIMPTVLKLFK